MANVSRNQRNPHSLERRVRQYSPNVHSRRKLFNIFVSLGWSAISKLSAFIRDHHSAALYRAGTFVLLPDRVVFADESVSETSPPAVLINAIEEPAPSSTEEEMSKIPLATEDLSAAASKKLEEEEEERKKSRRSRRGRIQELEEIRGELAEKELVMLEKEKELLDKEQTLMVLREELEIERKLRALLIKEKEKALEEAALAMGLCGGGSMLP